MPPDRRKLTMVTPRFGQAQGGLGNSAERIARHLASVHELTVFELTPELPRGTLRALSSAHWQVSAVGEGKEVMQFLVDVLVARATDCTLLGFYAGRLGFPLWLAARLLGAKLLLFARGNDVDLEPFGGDGEAIVSAWAKADGVLCVTRELERKVRAWAPGARTAYVPNGIDVEAFVAGAPRPARRPDARLRVGIFGELKHKKGLERLLVELDPERFVLRIVGSLRPDTEKFLHGMLTLTPELSESVVHVPFVAAREALLAEYAAVDAVCIPSLHEGMSNVMLEAMALGKTVIASRVGGALDALTHGVDAITFDPMHEGALGEALGLALELDRDELGRAARETVRRDYSAALERARTLDALERLLA